MKFISKNQSKTARIARGFFASLLIVSVILPSAFIGTGSYAFAQSESSDSSVSTSSENASVSESKSDKNSDSKNEKASESVGKNISETNSEVNTDSSDRKAESDVRKTDSDNKRTSSGGSSSKNSDDGVAEGTGGSRPEGTIRVCKMIVDQHNNIATSSAGLPQGGFKIQLHSSKDFSQASHLGTADFDAETFTPNASIILNQNDAECETFDGLTLNSEFILPVYYTEEVLVGNFDDIQPWLQPGIQFLPRYNDQFNVEIHDLDDFFLYTPQLFDSDPNNDAERNDNSDGLITLKVDRLERTLVLLNRYQAPEQEIGTVEVCKMIADSGNNIATSSAGLSVGGFKVHLHSSPNFDQASFIGSADFTAESFTPNKSIILGGNDAECRTFNIPLNATGLTDVYYTEEVIVGDFDVIQPWLDYIPTYSDQHNIPIDDIGDFFFYSPELFDGNPNNDDERNLNTDGYIALEQNRPNRTLVVLNRYEAEGFINTPPTITLVGSNPMEIVRGNDFVDPGATAFDAEDGDLTSEIFTSGNVDTDTLGSYLVTYTVFDSGGLTASTSRTVNVIPGGGGGDPKGTVTVCKMIADTNGNIATSSTDLPAGNFRVYLATSKTFGSSIFGTASFNAENFTPNQSIILGENDAECIEFANLPLSSTNFFDVYYTEERVIGLETSNPWVGLKPLHNDQHNVTVMTLSDFFEYSPELFDNDPSNDDSRNLNSDGYIALEPARAERTLVLLNRYPATSTPVNTPPTITLVGDNPMSVFQNETFTDPGATAFDAEDGDLTSAIVATGTVNVANLGSYTIDYSVTDSGGLSATTSRIVNVIERDNPGGGGGGGGRRSSSGGSLAPQECSYLEDFLRRDWNNDPVEMLKLQLFLKNFEGFTSLEATAVFDDATFDAVSAFQQRYFDDILEPWGHTAPTGFVYILTKKKINEIYCNTIYPLTPSESREIVEFRALLESIRSSSDIPGVLEQIENLNLEDLIGTETSTSTIANIIPTIVDTTGTNRAEETERNNLGKVAAAIFSIPSDFSELVQSLYLLLIALVAVYLLTEIALGVMEKSKMTPDQNRARRYGMYAGLLILSAIIAAWYEAYSIVIPIVILAIVSGSMMIVRNTSAVADKAMELPAPEKKEEEVK